MLTGIIPDMRERVELQVCVRVCVCVCVCVCLCVFVLVGYQIYNIRAKSVRQYSSFIKLHMAEVVMWAVSWLMEDQDLHWAAKEM